MIKKNSIVLEMGCLILLALCVCSQGAELPRLDLKAKQLTFSKSGAEDPSIIQTTDGSIWIAWIDKSDSHSVHLWCKRAPDGQTWTQPLQITKGQVGNHYYPSLLQASDGTLCITWFSDRSGNADVWFSDSRDGIQWSAPRQITRDSSWDWTPSLTQTSDKTLWLAWASTRSGNKDVWVSNSTDRTTWSSPRRLAINTIDNEDFPCLSRSHSGGLLLTWTRYKFKKGQTWNSSFSNPSTEIYLARSGDGTTWTPPERLTQNRSVDLLSHQCPADEKQSNLVVWTSAQTDVFGDIVGIWLAGVRRSATVQFTSGKTQDYSPKAILASDGNYWLTWVSKRSGTLNIWYATFKAADLHTQ
jgi:hypothetical protein